MLTSDHGAGFVPGESHRGFDGETLDESLYPDILYVPLIVKAPGIEAGTVSDANVMSVDILPTVADVLGIEVPWAVDGRSLLGTPRDDPEKQFNKVDLSGGPFGGFGGAVELAETQTFDGDAVLAENLARNLDTVLVGDNPGHRLYAIDRDGDLVGTDIADLSEGDAVTATLVVDGGLAAIEAFGPQDEVVPVHVEGLVEGGLGRRPHRRDRRRRGRGRRRAHLRRRRGGPPPRRDARPRRAHGSGTAHRPGLRDHRPRHQPRSPPPAHLISPEQGRS